MEIYLFKVTQNKNLLDIKTIEMWTFIVSLALVGAYELI